MCCPTARNQHSESKHWIINVAAGTADYSIEAVAQILNIINNVTGCSAAGSRVHAKGLVVLDAFIAQNDICIMIRNRCTVYGKGAVAICIGIGMALDRITGTINEGRQVVAVFTIEHDLRIVANINHICVERQRVTLIVQIGQIGDVGTLGVSAGKAAGFADGGELNGIRCSSSSHNWQDRTQSQNNAQYQQAA